MYLYGLHLLDVGVIALYVVFIMWLGYRVSKRTRDTTDFYIAGRKLGKFYQFFLNFGSATDAQQAATVSREIYRQGIGGLWIQYLVLFLTPFYWFTSMLFRRSRLITIGDFFTERFQSKFLGGAYAVFILVMAVIGSGTAYLAAGKTMKALTPKDAAEFTEAERAQIAEFEEYRALQARVASGLDDEEQTRYEELHERSKRGELQGFISHTNDIFFYVVFAAIVTFYTVMGGFTAAAITDAIQGILIVVFSMLLIPIGLAKIGGFAGLHAQVPDYKFALFGSEALSEYAWYTILAMALANLVSIIANAPMMATAGSARDEFTARVGILGGMFFKRFIMLFWALAGLIAIALYAGQLDDPDLIWGHMTHQLLVPGAIGLMLAGVLAASMSTLDAGSVSQSALFIRNLYQPLRPGRTEHHYINVGRVVIVAILVLGVLTASWFNNLLTLFKYFISLPAVFGAAIWLGFVWRRLTRWAVILQVVVCFTLYALLPNVFPEIESITSAPSLLEQTEPREVMVTSGALVEDVEAGRAEKLGQAILKPRRIEPVGIFFEKVVREDPTDPDSRLVGQGRFQAEIWVLSLLGIDFSSWTKAQLETARFAFDALVPFLLLVLLSYLTRPGERRALDRFFGKMHTPVQKTPEEDAEAVECAANHPEDFEPMKLWRGSNWEILKPSRMDILGFGASWLLVGMMIFFLWLLVTIGA